jgi:hypothetical protein
MKEGEHSTLNIQLPTSKGSGVGHFVFPWAFGVECWALNVFLDFPEVTLRADWAGDTGGDERGEMKEGEHRTSNIELPTSNGGGVGPVAFCSAFGVRCSVFDVLQYSPEVPS